jgi:hypothetical protein
MRTLINRALPLVSKKEEGYTNSSGVLGRLQFGTADGTLAFGGNLRLFRDFLPTNPAFWHVYPRFS